MLVRQVWFAPEHDDGSGGSGEVEGTKRGNGTLGHSTILVVEDDVLARLATADFLRDCGYRVVEAANAEEAQAILRSSEVVDLLFSDVDLGSGITGVELARWTREHFPSVRILLSSGVSVDVANGLCDRPLVVKPYGFAALAEEIGQVLGALSRKRQ